MTNRRTQAPRAQRPSSRTSPRSGQRGAPLAWLLAAGVLAFGVTSGAFGCGDDLTDGSVCEAGTEVFCRCAGGIEGTKLCDDNGRGFGECRSIDGPCPEIPDTTSSSPSGPTTTTGTGGGGGAGGGDPCEPGTGDGERYDACECGNECASGICAMGLCSESCTGSADCSDGSVSGVCASVGGEPRCLFECWFQSECSQYGEGYSCGWASPHGDNEWSFGCGTWSPPEPAPLGTACDGLLEDFDCHGDIPGSERICSFGECIEGCHRHQDCPTGEQCSQTGGDIPGTCE